MINNRYCLVLMFLFMNVCASMAQARRITKEFKLHSKFYAIDSTTIDDRVGIS